jgi:hypothetical protein
MVSSGGGSANPMFLSQGGTPMPNIPIAGQPKTDPQTMGSYQEFLPEVAPAGRPGYQILPAGGGRNPSATGLTAEMFKYRSPSGVLTPPAAAAAAPAGGSDIDAMKQQIASLQAQAGNGQFGAAREPQHVNAIWGGGSPAPGGYWSVPPATS